MKKEIKKAAKIKRSASFDLLRLGISFIAMLRQISDLPSSDECLTEISSV